METVYFSDDSKDSLCSQSLKEQINNVSRRLDFELEQSVSKPCDSPPSSTTASSSLVPCTFSIHPDQTKSSVSDNPIYPKENSLHVNVSQADSKNSMFKLKHTLTYGIHDLVTLNQLQSFNASSKFSTPGPVRIHRPWEVSTVTSVTESCRESLQTCGINWLNEDFQKHFPSAVLSQSPVAPPVEFRDTLDASHEKGRWPLTICCSPSNEPLDLTTTKTKVSTSVLATANTQENKKLSDATQGKMEQAIVNVNQCGGRESAGKDVDQVGLRTPSHSITTTPTSPEHLTFKLSHESKTSQSLSIPCDEADGTENLVNPPAIKKSVSIKDAVLGAPENIVQAAEIPEHDVKEDTDVSNTHSRPYHNEDENSGNANDSDDTVQCAWAFLNEQPLSIVDSVGTSSISSPVHQTLDSTDGKELSGETGSKDHSTLLLEATSTDYELVSPESSGLPSFTFLQPNMDNSCSLKTPHVKLENARKFPEVYDFMSESDNELPSLTFQRPLKNMPPHSQPNETAENNSECDNTLLAMDRDNDKNTDLIKISSSQLMDSLAEEGSIHYNADVSKTQLFSPEANWDSSNLKTKQTCTGSVWSVKTAVQSLTTPSIKVKLCRISSPSNHRESADDVNTAFVTTASSTSENSSAAQKYSSRIVEGASQCEESTIVSLSPQHYKVLSSVISCPSTPELSNNHTKLPVTIIRRPGSSRTTVQASSTPRQTTVSREQPSKPKSPPLARDNQNLHRIAVKNKLSSKCQGSGSIFNLAFTKEAQKVENSESETQSTKGETKSVAITTTNDTTDSRPTVKVSKSIPKHPKRSLFRTLKQQLLCGNPEMSMMSLQNETIAGNCFGRPFSRPCQTNINNPSPRKRTGKLPNLAIPHCGQGVTSTATLAFVTLNSTSQSSNKTCNSWCQQLASKMSPKIATNSKTGKLSSPNVNLKSEKTCPSTEKQQQMSVTSTGTSTSSLPHTANTATIMPLSQGIPTQDGMEEKLRIKEHLSTPKAVSNRSDQSSTKYVTLVPKQFGNNTPSSCFKLNSNARKLESDMSDNSESVNMKKRALQIVKNMDTHKVTTHTVNSESGAQNVEGDNGEFFKLPMDPDKYLCMRREQKRRRHFNQSSSSSDTSTASLHKKRAEFQNPEAGCDKEIVMAREVGKITAEWLTSFMNNRNMKRFQSRVDNENSKQVLLFLCRRCYIKVTESDADPALITLTKSRCSRPPTDHDVRHLIRRTRRQ